MIRESWVLNLNANLYMGFGIRQPTTVPQRNHLFETRFCLQAQELLLLFAEQKMIAEQKVKRKEKAFLL